MGDVPDEVDLIADRRAHYSLAAQVQYQCRVLTMLKTLALHGKGGLVLERLRDPSKMAKWYADTYNY
jgi:hypothetical protein